MSSLARDTPLQLLPAIAHGAELRAGRLGLPMSGYVAILVWNQAHAPVPVERTPDSRELARVRVGCYFRREIAPLARSGAKSAKLSVNAYVEALIARDLREPDAPLLIYPEK